jgi:hypothetical protein
MVLLLVGGSLLRDADALRQPNATVTIDDAGFTSRFLLTWKTNLVYRESIRPEVDIDIFQKRQGHSISTGSVVAWTPRRGNCTMPASS